MTTVAKPAQPGAPTTLSSRPPMPSITASALLESTRLLALTRRALAAWLTRA
jgi:hypothetical protein